MKFSLILCTLERTEEVESFICSASKQTYKNFEIIIVDQNTDDRINKIIDKFLYLDIIHIKSAIGLSLSRNLGLQKCSGDIFCFPDDDCTYPVDLLENINIFFDDNNYDLLMGKTIDKVTRKIVAGNTSLKKQELNTFYTLGSSTTLFIKNIKNIKFDERFGLGSKFGSEEENDLVFRLLKEGYTGFYNPEINYVFHPAMDTDFSNIKRIKNRSIGLGAFIAKHLFTKEGMIYFTKYILLRPLLGSFVYLLKFDLIKSNFYFNKWIGICKGFINYYRYKNEANI